MLNIASKLRWKGYIHKNGKRIDNYKFAHYHDDQIQGFIDTMPMLKMCRWRSSFVKMTGSELEWHTDKNNKCAILWSLKGWKNSCTYFNPHRIDGGRHDHYQKYVLKDYIMDTQVEHKVELNKNEKIIYKISIIDKDFDWLIEKWEMAYKAFKISKK